MNSRAEKDPVAVVILAAGEGRRMQSDLAKVLHPVACAPMLAHVLSTANALAPERIVAVVGHGGASVAEAARAIDPEVAVVRQEEQQGTGHAVLQARQPLDGFAGDVIVLYGDSPMIRPGTLEAMRQARRDGSAVVVLGFEAAEPTGYGRLIRDGAGALTAIVEEKDASDAEREETLCNSGVFCVDGAKLFGLLDRVGNTNAKGEYYLTDIVAIACGDRLSCAVVICDEAETLGVNNRAELAAAEAAFQARARLEALENGVTLPAPDTVYFAFDTMVGRDATIGQNVVFGPGVTVESGAEIRAFSHLEGCHVSAGAVVGPFARLRPGAEIGDGARIGNFVEVKNTVIAEGAKANHLAYLGDTEVGPRANIGAGTITCNYDGYLKHRTEIGAEAFIGSNAALVAPVRIGDGATVGAGSTITRRRSGPRAVGGAWQTDQQAGPRGAAEGETGGDEAYACG